jgi:hypothetical protein
MEKLIGQPVIDVSEPIFDEGKGNITGCLKSPCMLKRSFLRSGYARAR